MFASRHVSAVASPSGRKTDAPSGWTWTPARTTSCGRSSSFSRSTGPTTSVGAIEVLRNELESLDTAFGNPDVPKYLVVFGPDIYNHLQDFSQRICRCSLNELFPDRHIIQTGIFYNNHWKPTRLLRQLHYLREDENPVDIADIELVQ